MKSNLATTTTLADLAAVTLLAGLMCLATFFAVGQSGSSGANAMQIQKMLTDRELWGADAFALFAGLQCWKNAGESSILVFPDRVVGGNKYDSPPAAEQSVSRLSAVMKAAPPKLRPEYQAAYRESLARAAAFKIRAERFLEDDSFHIVMQRESGQFLKPGIPMSTITDRYGKPEKTTTEVVHAQGDRRPAVLTVHWYAGSTIKFVQSDLAPRPETVDRVVIDTNAIISQLY